MKTTVYSQSRGRPWLKTGAMTIGAWLACFCSLKGQVGTPAKPAEDKPALSGKEAETKEAESAFDNLIEMSVGGTFVSGDKAAFQRRWQMPGGAFGGIENLHWEHPVKKNGLFTFDGRGIFDNHDYMVKLGLANPDIGFVQAGYREFRTWYDGSGGYYPAGNLWGDSLVPGYNDNLHLDRGEVWFEGGLTLPKKPAFTFRYSHQFRSGQKDSTSWGETGLEEGPAAGSSRNIVPAFLNIDETRDIFKGDLKHTLGKTGLGLGLRYEMQDIDNARYMRMRPNEVGSDQHISQRDQLESDIFSVHAFSETRLNQKVRFSAGYAFTTLDSDLSGYRLYGSAYDPDLGVNRLPPLGGAASYENLSGGSQMAQHVINLNLMYQLKESLVLVPAVRLELRNLDSVSHWTSPAMIAAGDPSESFRAQSERGLQDLSESLDLRYSGITNWVWYARANWLQGSGDLKENLNNVSAGVTDMERKTDDERFWQKYAVGANWYPHKRLSLSAEYYFKRRENDYDHTLDSTPNSYPAFLTAQQFDTDDVNCRLTWRPRYNLTFVTRYDFQFSTVDTTGPDAATGGISTSQTADISSQIISESISWSPWSRLYLQGHVSVVWDKTETSANDITYLGYQLVPPARNNYWNASFMAGYALTEKTDLQAQYVYYRADNYDPNTIFVPYGAGAEEQGVLATLVHRLSKHMQWTLKYSYFNGHDDTSGGHNNYAAHLAYTSLQYRF